jgi:RecA/RadA recombinase
MVKDIDGIITELKLAKERKLVKVFDKIQVNGVPAIDLNDKLATEERECRLQTGTLVDGMIRGGLPPSASFLLYGEPATGKSEICITMAVLCPDHVIFIDTEGSFRAQRLQEICNARGLDYKTIASKITYYRPINWIEQMYLLQNLPSPADVGKIGLIIVDSLTKLFRGIEFAGRGELNVRQPLIREWGINLKEVAENYGCGWVLTTQVYQKPDSSSSFMPEWTTFQAVGGLGLEHQTSYTMILRHGEGNVKIARLVDADDVPLGERPFRITAKGVEELTDSEKSQEIEKKALGYEQKVQSCLDEPTRKAKKKAEEDKAKGKTAEVSPEQFAEANKLVQESVAKTKEFFEATGNPELQEKFIKENIR